jgi:hypothetical protein
MAELGTAIPIYLRVLRWQNGEDVWWVSLVMIRTNRTGIDVARSSRAKTRDEAQREAVSLTRHAAAEIIDALHKPRSV